ncbi:ATP-dependent RNA helicase dbp10 [Mytilinidion resinicola]|uniref:RNA helicase n=1 Tax=Mytilinidion resinicola TaxID=574789 RepID=A0A6A6YXB1_9PEZI|nr:ATP-dependent RNA helicase dbp10 [Mytilinidion resinicola]KAF2813198.1 ATP-dependent RNA helicase dbp10 [Mytilinidion resinicola]
MAPRASSPALSENEYDISNALFNDLDAFNSNNRARKSRAGQVTDLGKELELGGLESGDSGDEEFIAAQQAASNRKSSSLKGNTVKKGGGFQAMGLNPKLLKAIARKGFQIPTPIQRKIVPLILDGQDVVGMARTGSGKTAAFVMPLIDKLRGHSAKVGARAIVMSPSRELALQTLKVIKDLGRGTDLRTILLVGGESLEDQFTSMATNPDVIIATPGRLLHLKVEMQLDLSSVRYMVFDEADRLFEMGFAAQLAEILHALPTSRQTLLFSATLPKSLVEFARAGLQEPKLIRLDAESKISPNLESVFFTVKSAEKDGALLHILQDIIKLPTGQTASKSREAAVATGKKRKRAHEGTNAKDSPTEHSTIVFASTKHHVEYLAALLRSLGYATSYVYGSLDQMARSQAVQDFRSGITSILVTTDVAARGIDIPVLANVINFDFPPQPKIYVHRVGRTARAGLKGWSYSLVGDAEAPYLLDLQLFLSRRLVLGREATADFSFAQDIVVGTLVRDRLESACEAVAKRRNEDLDLLSLHDVAAKGFKLYKSTRNAASTQSVKRAKVLVSSGKLSEVNLLFADDISSVQLERENMLAKVSGFRPLETVFELGKRSGGGGEAAEVMRKTRQHLEHRRHRSNNGPTIAAPIDHAAPSLIQNVDKKEIAVQEMAQSDPDTDADSDEMEVFLSQPASGDVTKDGWEDAEHFMSYAPKSTNLAEDRGYSVHSHQPSFVEAARGATMDLNNDDSAIGQGSKARMRWDKKSKKYVATSNDTDGSKGTRMVRGESGMKIAASFRSGRFDKWRKSNKVGRLPRIGELESASTSAPRDTGRRFKHKSEKAPKEADKYRDDYHVRKQRVQEAKEKRVGKFRDGGAKNELRGVEDVRKQRKLKERRKEKNARPSKKRKI